MGSIHIVTDSSARFLGPAPIGHPRLHFAPVTVQFPNRSIEERPDLGLEAYRADFAASPGQATPVAPSVQQLERIYGELQGQTDQILSIHTSAGISAGYRNALKASEPFRGRSSIQVIDSTSLSVGLGMLVSAALESVENGSGLEEVVRQVRGLIPRLYAVFFLDELIYLERNVLVSRSQSILGNMLGILPFLTVEHGRLITMEKVRNRPRAQEKLIEFVSEFAGIERLALLHSTAEPDEEARLVAERLQALYPEVSIAYVNYGPSAATFLGLNGLGAIVLEREAEVE